MIVEADGELLTKEVEVALSGRSNPPDWPGIHKQERFFRPRMILYVFLNLRFHQSLVAMHAASWNDSL